MLDAMSDAVVIAFIGMLGSVLTVGLSLWTQVLVKRQDAKIVKTQETIHDLEKNTNSIKDALVEVTRKAAFARGVKAGGGASPTVGGVDLLAAANAAASVATAAAVAAAAVATAAAAAAASLAPPPSPTASLPELVIDAARHDSEDPLQVKLVD